ncbi:hypothetical protein CNMCM7691_004238 [Aspergillus felis]|uniref:Survival protein SurE-like phosphatase/nucleotidase domain-containing protein n=1 Tax=Aspergillus felis TaxID=1287682 RepID=A0A8H6R5D6_9EURO|nr:hypothetical protein CNMCM7691_004238 [Aspergillus felis]
MHLLPLVLLPLTAQAINIVSSNDDGWAEINIRQFYQALTAAGHSVVVSAPAENQSGTGSSDKTPTTLTEPCEFNSCPSGSPATGYNSSDPRLNYVNSYPVTSMKYGISTAAPPFFNNAPPALAVSGPNVGSNLGLAVYFSGTVGAAHYASEAGIPAIAFSGSTGSQTAWNVAVPAYSQVYAQLATKITNKIVASGTPYLPNHVWLNVNFPEVSTECASADDFKFVLSRIFSGLLSADDVETCGSSRLPTESTVVGTDGCYVSISVGWSDKTDAAADVQAIVLDKLVVKGRKGIIRYGSDEKSPLEKVSDYDMSYSYSDDDPIPESAGQIKVALFRVLASGEIKRGEYLPSFDGIREPIQPGPSVPRDAYWRLQEDIFRSKCNSIIGSGRAMLTGFCAIRGRCLGLPATITSYRVTELAI